MFDYEANTEVDVSSVADAIRSSHRLAPLTDQQKLQRRIQQEIHREEQAWKAEQRRAERERRKQEAEATARYEAAVALSEQNRKRRLEREAEISRQVRDREIRDLRFQSEQQQAWQNNVTSSFRQTLANRQVQATFAEIDSIINPPAPAPAPEPEQTVVAADDGLGSPNIGDEDFNPRYWLRKPIFRR
jgi:Asp-tRNA(Asn)/Glu-tRNA(Gln) amidotransferase A subunit family amidase